MYVYRFLFAANLAFCLLAASSSMAQINWNKEGNSYTSVESGAIVQTTLPGLDKSTLVTAEQLTPLGLAVRERSAGAARGGRGGGEELRYQFCDDQQKVLLFTRPFRQYHNTFYSCWVFDRKTNVITPVAKQFPASSLLNAKISPDGSKVAFVYDNNIYSYDLASGTTTALTTSSHSRMDGIHI